MEKYILKGAMYGLLLALGGAILFVDYAIIYDFEGGYSKEYLPVYDYVVKILRTSVVGSLIGAFLGGFGLFIVRRNEALK